MSETPYISIEEAGKRLFGVSRAQSYELAKSGVIPTVKIGPRRMVVPLQAILDAQPVLPAAPKGAQQEFIRMRAAIERICSIVDADRIDDQSAERALDRIGDIIHTVLGE